jgi:NADPH:quinone reductase-like Zn-dependent oxidoreductase
VPLVTLTAFACLDRLPPLAPGGAQRKVVVAGASGGTGMWCVQRMCVPIYPCRTVLAGCERKEEG